MIRIVTYLQGIYYLVNGIWPMLHMESFVAVTGPKEDYWLVRMVALLSISIGAAILSQKKGPYVLHFTTGPELYCDRLLLCAEQCNQGYLPRRRNGTGTAYHISGHRNKKGAKAPLNLYDVCAYATASGGEA